MYVSKRDMRLYVYNRQGDIVADYKIAAGMNSDKKSKLYAGDNRTPEGVYRIIEIWSMDAQKNTPAYKKLMKYNQVYFRARDGHYRFGRPDADLGDNAYGPRFYLLDYPTKEDVMRYERAVAEGEVPVVRGNVAPIGWGIAIHGNNDEASIGHLSSSGCIRMYNNDIIDLEKYIESRPSNNFRPIAD